MNELSNNRTATRLMGRRMPSYFELLAEELKRHGGGGAGKSAGGDKTNGSPPSHPWRTIAVEKSGAATALSRASGDNAVVVKLLSYGAGAGSARNVLTYQSKEEKARDQDGKEVSDINAAVRQWEREFGNRKGSKDIARFCYELENADRESVARALGSLAGEGFRDAGDTDRTYAFSVSPGVNGQTRLHFALVIAHEKQSRADRKSGTRIPGELEHMHVIDERLTHALRNQGTYPVSRAPIGYASGQKGLTASLHAMQRDGAEVTLSTKTQIRQRERKSGIYERTAERRELTTGDHKEITTEGKTVSALMQSRQPRDFMHLLLSGPANVDRDQFILAGREFLKQQFDGHRYAYAVHNRHDMAKHPHLHVIVALRNARGGKPLNPNIRDFTEWRQRFADKARERGIAIDRQKRVERAGPPPVKRWEWEMFHRMGATAPSNVIDKVLSKIKDRPTLPRLEQARENFEKTRRSVNRIIKTLEDQAKDRAAPSTIRELSQDMSIGLQREYNRLEMAIREGRDPIREKGQVHMMRSTPISRQQANAAKEALADKARETAAKITNPADREIFEKAANIIGKVAGLQLDLRVVKEKERGHSDKARDNRKSTGVEMKPTDGRDEVADTHSKTLNNPSVDGTHGARSNA
ncbi:MAG: relaxase/mobilization nuclease domain-containing protein, partial [Phyllobacterium sp.]